MRGGGSRRWSVALIAYYAVIVVIVGPMCFSRARAELGARVPVRISLSLAMRSKTTDIATFATRAPLTVGVGADGTFTLPSKSLAFTPVDVPIATPPPRLGMLTVQAAATDDFAGTVNPATGTVTLDGSLELLWSKPSSTYNPSQEQMLDCPVGPFAVHLSTATVGGMLLSRQSSPDPTGRTATLVDSTPTVGAVPDGTTQCEGDERSLNLALSLPILPTTAATTSTTTTTIVPASSTTITTAPTTTTGSSTTTTVAPLGTPTTPNGFALNPTVLASEPTPSVVATLTIATMPSPTSPALPANASTTISSPATATPSMPPPAAPAPTTPDHQHRRAVKAATHRSPHKDHANRHAQSDATTLVTGTNSNANRPPPPLYFSPSYFGPLLRLSARNPSPASAPLSSLVDSVAHPNALSALYFALLTLPLFAFGLGLIASDLGWHPRLPGRRRRNASGKPLLYR